MFIECIMDAAVYKLIEQMPVVNSFRKDSCIEVCCEMQGSSGCAILLPLEMARCSCCVTFSPNHINAVIPFLGSGLDAQFVTHRTSHVTYPCGRGHDVAAQRVLLGH